MAGAFALGRADPAQASQGGWRWCRWCQGLWFSGNGWGGFCPNPYPDNGTEHSSVFSGNYLVKFSSEGGPGQDGWRWCSFCEGLWFARNGLYGDNCPSYDFTHFAGDSGAYRLPFATGNDPGMQSNWRWCSKCEGLWFAGNNTGGFCNGEGAHDQTGSGNYILRVT